MSPIQVSLIVEGQLDEQVLHKLLAQVAPHLQAEICYGRRGRDWIDSNMSKYNQAAQQWPFVALADLEQTECPPDLLRVWFPHGRNNNLQARIAVRMVEAWLLADREACAEFLGIAVHHIPQLPDDENHPKKLLVNLARRSRYRAIRDDIVPAPKTTGIVGKNYLGQLGKFVIEKWQPERAQIHSYSLRRAINALQQFHPDISGE